MSGEGRGRGRSSGSPGGSIPGEEDVTLVDDC